ncbi:MAG: HD-GYP domain-containing protein [Lachnospiraceae bacterium]|nr:HD-GYP domain-containing protein [Lachnospiraceae bacterium]
MEFIQRFQLDLMLVMIGVCGILAVMALLTKTLSRKRRHALVALETSVMLLLFFDRLAYIYRGDVSSFGFLMTRVSNFCVFFFSLFMIHAVNLYLADLIRKDGEIYTASKILVAVEALFLAGVILLIVSQFTGLYYTFDEQNRYQRADGFIICYLFPLVMTALQIVVVLRNRQNIRAHIRVPVLLFMIIPYLASIAQIFLYGISLTNLATGGLVIMLYIYALQDLSEVAANANRMKIRYLQEERRKIRNLFEETAEALVSAIDAKDRYTHGHSSRVARYSERIARLAGMSDSECDDVYFAALLHDVGKIGIPDSIINKDGRLTEDEYAVVKRHPEIGRAILANISHTSDLTVGAHYHHERYDGKGYPEGLKGDKIPAVARIIAVADSYDTMTSRRSYRNPIPQAIAREEFVKGAGTQFDPEFAQIMVQLIDQDEDYRMKDNGDFLELSMTKQLHLTEQGFTFSQGALIVDAPTRLRFRAKADPGHSGKESVPVLLLYDSEDKLVHAENERGNTAECTVYGQIRFDGSTSMGSARLISTTHMENGDFSGADAGEDTAPEEYYEAEVVRYRDHIRVRMTGSRLRAEHIVALPYSACFAYVAITGAHCMIDRISVERDHEKIGPGDIPRIAPEIRFDDGPEGDLPNLQIDGYRSDATEGIPLRDSLKLSFHAKSLPMSKLVWHCPFVVLYDAEGGICRGRDYREFALIRFDGEHCPLTDHAVNETRTTRTETFGSWDKWKERNQEGLDCSVKIRRKGNRIITVVDHAGLRTQTVTTVTDEDSPEVFAALTGDLVALTEIRIAR